MRDGSLIERRDGGGDGAVAQRVLWADDSDTRVFDLWRFDEVALTAKREGIRAVAAEGIDHVEHVLTLRRWPEVGDGPAKGVAAGEAVDVCGAPVGRGVFGVEAWFPMA